MTTELYYDSAYLTNWETTIVDTKKLEDGYYVQLQDTAFYPHGGGQPCDLGMIQGIPVLDVVNEGDQILHKLEQLPEERIVSCSIDWQRRFDHMQQHSGQHLLSAVCLDLFQFKTASFHLGVDYCTIDIEATEVSSEQLEAIEREVNRHIYLNHSIRSYFVTEEEVNQLQLVKQTNVTDNIRIVEIQDIEYNACGGTHVSATGEIGIIKLLKVDKQKGNIRIYFKCGNRALEEFAESQRILNALFVKFNSNKDSILDRIDKSEKEQKQLQAELGLCKDKLDDYAVQELVANVQGNLIANTFEDKSLKDLQNLANKICSLHNGVVLLASAYENKVVLAQSSKSDFSCGAFLKSNLAAYNGKGGGSDILAQAGFSTWDDTNAFYEFTKRTI